MNSTHTIMIIAVAAAVTVLLRFVPFLIFGGNRETPAFVSYLGKVLPYAIMATYCIDPAYMNTLMATAHIRPRPFVSSTIPNPAPRTIYPAITGTEAINAFLMSSLLTFISSFFKLSGFLPWHNLSLFPAAHYKQTH